MNRSKARFGGRQLRLADLSENSRRNSVRYEAVGGRKTTVDGDLETSNDGIGLDEAGSVRG